MAPIATEVVNEVVQKVLPFIHRHQQSQGSKKGPFILGVTGPQGSGKTTWAKALLQSFVQDYGLKTVKVSIDDFYFDHNELDRVAQKNWDNKLFRHRGQPGTHDEQLVAKFFASLKGGDGDILVPIFDKSLYNGEGGRAPIEEWQHVPRDPPIDLVIFEGWNLGYRPLSEDRLEKKWLETRERAKTEGMTAQDSGLDVPINSLANHELEHLKVTNRNLQRYYETFMGPDNFDFLIHLDALELTRMYKWRIEQEDALRAAKGTTGLLTDQQIIRFVGGYAPAHELYLDDLRNVPFFPPGDSSENKGQLRLILDRNRKIVNLDS
jgi:D-glycerate 3-kinase